MSIIVISSKNQRAKGRSARALSFAPANDYAICGVDLFYLDPVFGSETRNILRLAFLGDYSLETTTRSFLEEAGSFRFNMISVEQVRSFLHDRFEPFLSLHERASQSVLAVDV